MEKSTNNKKAIIFYALTSLILICIIGILVFIANKHLSSIKNDMPINNSSTNQSNDLITADVDVKIKTKTFEFSCNKLEISNDNYNNDYRLVSFHVTLKNLSYQKIIVRDYDDFYCSVSNKLQTNVTNKDNERKKLSKTINVNESSDGYITFEVPKDTKVFELKYEDALLHIELLNNKNANLGIFYSISERNFGSHVIFIFKLLRAFKSPLLTIYVECASQYLSFFNLVTASSTIGLVAEHILNAVNTSLSCNLSQPRFKSFFILNIGSITFGDNKSISSGILDSSLIAFNITLLEAVNKSVCLPVIIFFLVSFNDTTGTPIFSLFNSAGAITSR